jgi:hypothetical protein
MHRITTNTIRKEEGRRRERRKCSFECSPHKSTMTERTASTPSKGKREGGQRVFSLLRFPRASREKKKKKQRCSSQHCTWAGRRFVTDRVWTHSESRSDPPPTHTNTNANTLARNWGITQKYGVIIFSLSLSFNSLFFFRFFVCLSACWSSGQDKRKPHKHTHTHTQRVVQ